MSDIREPVYGLSNGRTGVNLRKMSTASAEPPGRRARPPLHDDPPNTDEPEPDEQAAETWQENG